MGAVKQAKGRVGRRPKPPSPPADSTAARSAGDQPDKPPQRAPASQVQPVLPPAQARGCKGRSPLHKKTIISPPSRREERSASAGGGMGARNKANGRVGRRPKPPSPPADTTAARSAGDQPDKPPAKKHLRIPGNPEFRGVSVFNSRKSDYFDASVSATVGSLMSATYFRTFSLVRLEVSILSFSVEPSSTKAYPPMVSSESVRRMLSSPVQS